MLRPLSLLSVSALLAFARAGEVTVESRPFFVPHHFSAHVVAAEQEAVWKGKNPAEVMSMAAPGKVDAGAILSSMRTDGLDIEIAKAKEGGLPNVAALEEMRRRLEYRAPAAGWWFHGEVAGQQPAALKPVGTFVAGNAVLSLVAKVPETVARRLAKDAAGSASFAGEGSVDVPVKVASVAEVPAADGTWLVNLSATWPEGAKVVPGSILDVHLVTDRKDAAVTVPSSALSFGPEGWTVEVKLADGKTEARKVARGLVSGGRTEIVSGLETGQVVIVP